MTGPCVRYAVSFVLICVFISPFLQAAEQQLIIKENPDRSLFVFGGPTWNMIRKDGGKYIYCWDASAGVETVIYSSPVAIRHVMATKAGYIAFTDYSRESSSSVTYRLQILNPEAQIVRTVSAQDPIFSVSWSPDGKRLSYITGKSSEQLRGRGYDDAQTIIYDVETGTSKPVFDGGYQITWASFDGNIYIYEPLKSPAVSMYVVKTGEVVETELKSIQFSPDGAYYFERAEDQIEGFGLYRRAANEPFSVGGEAASSQLAIKRLEAVRWFDDQRIMCIRQVDGTKPLYQQRSFLFNVETGEILESQGFILHHYITGEAIIVKQDGRLNLETLASMRRIMPEDLPPPR